MRLRIGLALLLLFWCGLGSVLAESLRGVRSLYQEREAALATLPSHTHLLLDQEAIEQFLIELDGMPPDWSKVYGQGHTIPAMMHDCSR